jgi:predicted MPP superfamily phosphohydrolase
MILLLWLLGLVGHLGLWAATFNQIHSTACPRQARKLSEILLIVIGLLPPLLLGVAFLGRLWQKSPQSSVTEHFEAFSKNLFSGPYPLASWLFWLYVATCWLLGTGLLLRWLYRKFVDQPVPALVERQSRRIKVRQNPHPLLHGWFPRLLGLVPFNQVLQIQVERITWALDVPPELDGLRIVHLSDLHLTGEVDLFYFQQVVAASNQFEPDLVLVTGDLLDAEQCLDWIEPIFSQLKSRLGKYYVLGNHDRKISDFERLLREMRQAGFQHLRSGWVELPFGEGGLLLAGNELPWFAGAESLPLDSPEDSLKILLSHSPDQLKWARQRGFDLMLAGHTHGGQIAFPLIGPIIAPSRYGVKYAAGTFQFDGLLMHVSRGLSGDKPIRINCPPEIGCLTIRSARK